MLVVLIRALGGGSFDTGTRARARVGGFPGIGRDESADNTRLAAEGKTGSDAHALPACTVGADLNSIEDLWRQQLGTGCTETHPVLAGSAQTGCGNVISGSGSCYRAADALVSLDLSFLDTFQRQLGADGVLFSDAYVPAPAYGHDVQGIPGASNRVQAGITGPTSGSVPLTLQPDSYAGVGAQHTEQVPTESGQPLITQITADDVRALEEAWRIGDGVIQRDLGGGRADRSSVTHGSWAQRQKWLPAGYSSGDPNACDTFGTSDLG